MRTSRVVFIDELVFQHSFLSSADILRQHGIDPRSPYGHDQTTTMGGIVHRYTQPPRPQAEAQERDA
jgi:hypothetical protein